MKAPPIIPTSRTEFRRGLRFAIYFVASGLFAFGALIYLTMPRPPKEAALLKNFYANRAVFEELRDMLLADKDLRRVAGWGVDIKKPFFLGYPSKDVFPTDRYNRYLSLLKQVHALAASHGDGDAEVLVWGWGFAGSTRHIGVIWMTQPPTNQISTIDGYHSKEYTRPPVYRHIDQNWYLWTDM